MLASSIIGVRAPAETPASNFQGEVAFLALLSLSFAAAWAKTAQRAIPMTKNFLKALIMGSIIENSVRLLEKKALFTGSFV